MKFDCHEMVYKVDSDRCQKLLTNKGMIYDYKTTVKQLHKLFKQGYTFIFQTNEEAFEMNQLYQQWVLDNKIVDHLFIRKSSTDKVSMSDRHVKQ